MLNYAGLISARSRQNRCTHDFRDYLKFVSHCNPETWVSNVVRNRLGDVIYAYCPKSEMCKISHQRFPSYHNGEWVLHAPYTLVLLFCSRNTHDFHPTAKFSPSINHRSKLVSSLTKHFDLLSAAIWSMKREALDPPGQGKYSPSKCILQVIVYPKCLIYAPKRWSQRSLAPHFSLKNVWISAGLETPGRLVEF